MNIEQQVISGSCAHPFSILGPQTIIETKQKAKEKGKQSDESCRINVYFPTAIEVSIVNKTGKTRIAKCKQTPSGLFSADVALKKLKAPYHVKVRHEHGEYQYIDPYQFSAEAYHAVHFIDHAPQNIYQQAGAQLVSISPDSHSSDSHSPRINKNQVDGVRFAVFAPNASAVSVIGDFNAWNAKQHPMQKTDIGYWVLFVPGLEAGAKYKFALHAQNGERLPDKSDPIGFQQEQYPSHASVVYDHNSYKWADKKWRNKKPTSPYQQAMSIYEVHLGSWKRPNEPHQRYLNYRQLADSLIEYVTDMSYTHIEVLPVSEFPFDGSWGYQPVGLFAPTSRFGDADSFKYFVDKAHQAGIGVIIDWVPAHFPEDSHGLAQFDGTHLYEYADPNKGWHPDWKSYIYDFGNDSVRQFLVGNALYWFDKFHVDAIRVDAVASMLYLDYSREEGEWVPNVDGGNHNYEAISLLQWMNTEVYMQYPNAMTIAEESTSFAGVSRPVSLGGLGFGFKWNMGWMNDSLGYIEKDPAYRKYHHGELTFSMVYAYDENFILPISHDEVVHGKGSMIDKMPGDGWQKFANLRAYYGFMFGHPGKKLQFMGNEFAQPIEWNHDSQLRWEVLDNYLHAGVQRLYRDLNRVYRHYPALYELDHESHGFRWGELHNAELSVLSFIRSEKEQNKTQHILVVCNFTPAPRDNMRFGVPKSGAYKIILNTDEGVYGGSDYPTQYTPSAHTHAWHDMPYSLELNVPPLASIFLLYEG